MVDEDNWSGGRGRLHLRSGGHGDLELLARRVGGDAQPGRLALLEQWAADRRADQSQIGHASRWLPELFRVRQPLFAHSRQLGLLALDLLPTARKNFARRAMGL